MDQSKKRLSEIGFSDEIIFKILNSPSLCVIKDDTLVSYINNVYNFLIDKGFLVSQIIYMFTVSPEILSLSFENLNSKFDNLQKLGYSKNQVIKLISNNPNIFNNSVETINNKFKLLNELGYSTIEIIKMSLKTYTLLDLDVLNNIKKKLEDMIKLGFTYDQLIIMTIKHPDLFTYNINNISNKIDDLEKLGFSREFVYYILYKMPTLFGLSLKNIEEKINYLRKIDAIDTIIDVPTNLMQSVKLTYARYEFFLEKKIDMCDKTKKGWLFISSEKFEKRFRISKKDLLTKYDYSLYDEEKNK